MEQCVKEDALEVQDIRELGLGWAWFMNDLRAFLPAWQEMELASPSSEEPVTQIEADVPIEPLALQADATHLDLDLQVYERPLAVTPFGTPEVVPDWQDTHAMHASLETIVSVRGSARIWACVPFRVSAKIAQQENKWFSVSLEISIPDMFWKTCFVILIFRCHCTVNGFLLVVPTRVIHVTYRPFLCIASFLGLLDLMCFLWTCGLPVFLRGGGFPPPFQNLKTPQSAAPWIEDAEKDGEEESGTGVSEFNVKEICKVKDTRSDHRRACVVPRGSENLEQGCD